ncbi:MAG: DNA-binding protein [Candidatus Diapherotrites archaeon]|uniref:DNA-binding protein n=1 Tax=Candidatus Iainarchaeum sp. TaxID=3101447 RepID=A0A7J4ITL9_9ARCH|nr:MAG: hypothetical protein QT03_C0001G0525 [archaeon GW2011_AR10]MBS3059835.1 DNA-binding protein [Candidatus Diapherotrites archaeon]HIH08851.1 DNA-binding protein [Candidatus Diapherotrites archaeon]
MNEKTIVLELREGEDILDAVREASKQYSINFGFFVEADGTLKDCELVYNEPKRGIVKTAFRDTFKITAISGQIQKEKDGSINPLMNVALLGSRTGSKSGLLVGGKASKALKIRLRKVDLAKIIK